MRGPRESQLGMRIEYGLGDTIKQSLKSDLAKLAYPELLKV